MEKKRKHAGGRPTRYNKRYAAEAKFLAQFGLTDKDFAEFFGVTFQTINNWKKAHPEFFDSLKAGKEQADAKVEKSLYELATGYKHRVEKPLVVSDGRDFGSHVEYAKYVEQLPPNATAIIFWLKNRKPQEWRDKQEIEHTGNIILSTDADDANL